MFAKNVNELTNKVSGFKNAGGVLTMVSAGVTFTNIAQHVDQCNYREAWKEVGSFAGGLFAGLVLVATPMGFFTAFIIGGLSATGFSYIGSGGVGWVYDSMGNRGKIIDVIDSKRLSP